MLIVTTFKLAKVRKPTGDAVLPHFVSRAHDVERLMNEKAETADLDDSEVIDISSDSDDEDQENKAPVVKVKTEPGVHTTAGPTVHRAPNNRLRPPTTTSSGRAQERNNLLVNLTNTLDPAAQAARAEDRAARSFQSAQIMTLSSQVRDSQMTIENLRSQLAASERRVAAAERLSERHAASAARLLDKLEFLKMFSGGGFIMGTAHHGGNSYVSGTQNSQTYNIPASSSGSSSSVPPIVVTAPLHSENDDVTEESDGEAPASEGLNGANVDK